MDRLHLRAVQAGQRTMDVVTLPVFRRGDERLLEPLTDARCELRGGVVGLILGLGGAFFLEYLDQTIKSSADVERVIGVPVLGLVPLEASFSGRSNGSQKPVVAVSKLSPEDPAVEAFRSLRTNVTFVAAERPIQFLAVTSPGPGEGKSTTTVNLAVALAQSATKVLLVDGDLRRPVVHKAFQLIIEPGLTDILVGKATVRETVRADVAPNLDVLPAGPRPPNPSELLGSNAMQQFVAEVRRDYDYVVVDTPPTLPVTDSTVIGAAAVVLSVLLLFGQTSLDLIRAGNNLIEPILQASWLAVLAWLILAVAGFVYQLLRDRDFDFTKDRYVEAWG